MLDQFQQKAVASAHCGLFIMILLIQEKTWFSKALLLG